MNLDVLCSDTIEKYRRRLTTVKPDLSWNQLSDEELLYRLNAIGRSDKDSSLHPTVVGLLVAEGERKSRIYKLRSSK